MAKTNSTAYEVTNIAMSYLGSVTGSAGHRKIIKEFNKVKPHGYTASTSDPWCAEFWSACQIQAGNNASQVPLSASCSMIIADSKRLGLWIEKDSYVPERGDAILYDWQDSGHGDNTGDPDHIGMCLYVKDGYIYVIEGNKGSGICGIRAIPINGKCIRGFVHPDYRTIEAKKIKYRPKTPYTGKIPTKNDVYYTVENVATKKVQNFLNWCLNAKLDKDGKCGRKTEKWILNFQKTYGLEQDGCFGAKCRAKANKIVKKHRNNVNAPNKKAKKIADMAVKLAWVNGTPSSKYDGQKGSASPQFKKAYKKAFGKSPSTGCDMSVKLVLHECGYGNMSTSSWANTNEWLKKKFKRIKPKTKNGKIREDQFKAGDIVYWKKSGDSHHIYIIVEIAGKMCRAESVQHGLPSRKGDKWFHIGKGLNLDVHKVDYIYRAK